VGYGPEAGRAQRGFRAPLDDGWLGQAAADAAGALEHRPGSSCDPDFGQPQATEAVASAVRLSGKPIAVVLAERTGDESPWCPDGLAMAVTVAQLRLELDLALRKAQGAATTPAEQRRAVPAPEAPSEASAPEPAPHAPAAAPPDQGEVAAVEPTEPGEPPELVAARRYARLVATDIRLYNEEAVAQGKRNGDLLDRLGDQLGRGKETFLRRHGNLGPAGLEVLLQAYVDVLAGGDGNLIPRSFLD
jgi:hypothetical protein